MKIRSIKGIAKGVAKTAMNVSPIPIPDVVQEQLGLQDDKMGLISEKMDKMDEKLDRILKMIRRWKQDTGS